MQEERPATKENLNTWDKISDEVEKPEVIPISRLSIKEEKEEEDKTEEIKAEVEKRISSSLKNLDDTNVFSEDLDKESSVSSGEN